MKKRLLAVLLAPPLVWAQVPPPASPATADPADPAAAVPRVAYRSVFADTPTGVEAQQADWKKANADVGQFRRGHVDLLKWEEERARAAPAPATPSRTTGHHRHHGGHKP
ncbi:MAG: hypothetical protein LCH79_17740 [Proteobacteria bacterium]|nr:hypothetical protein [Ramlibacter sp.]MCA0215002.1 hypothetical protein [Pseudomonadota bacterium]